MTSFVHELQGASSATQFTHLLRSAASGSLRRATEQLACSAVRGMAACRLCPPIRFKTLEFF